MYVLAMISLFLSLKSKCQKFEISNKHIKYEIVSVGSKLINNRLSPSKYLIEVNIPESKKKTIRRLDKKKWLSLLNNNKTDWAANLLLYEFYKKDAVLYIDIITSKTKWVALQKKKDVTYWKKKLRDAPLQ